MSTADDDLFSPIAGIPDAKPDDDDQIEELYKLLSSMGVGMELTLNFDTHNTRFQLRLLGKF